MDANNLLPKLLLGLIPGVGAAVARSLMARAGDPASIFRLKRRDLLSIPGVGNQLAERILKHNLLGRAEEEIRFMEKERVDCRFLFDPDYPRQLVQCPDAPILLFIKGEMPGEECRYLSIIGTRNPTARGQRVTREFVQELALKNPSTVIISGLAYGIDVQAHLAALNAGLKTIAVLGHGFHTLYPAVHRSISNRITGQGALLSDFFSNNQPDPRNFIRRNRIIAGLSEATLVIESGVKGGAIVTAEMANSYNRDVFAVPGRPDDLMSKGCNHLIRTSQASLAETVEDIQYLLGWSPPVQGREVRQRVLFTELDPEEKAVVDALQEGPASVDQIGRSTGIPVQKMAAVLLNLEFKQAICALPGNYYTLNES
ncbi:MAG: DNA-processing protein DprA [Bacteroidales bacterium]